MRIPEFLVDIDVYMPSEEERERGRTAALDRDFATMLRYKPALLLTFADGRQVRVETNMSALQRLSLAWEANRNPPPDSLEEPPRRTTWEHIADEPLL